MKKFLLLLLLPFLSAAQEVYHIKFSDSESLYNVAILVWEDNTGMARVKYIDSECNTELVEMKATLVETTTGYVITCSDPIYAGTNRKAKSYNPDKFILIFQENDGWLCVNKDSANTETPCVFMEVTGLTNQDLFLKEFDWEFEKK